MRRNLPVVEGLALLALTLPFGLWRSAFWLLIPFALIVLTKRSFYQYGLRWHLGTPRLHVIAGATALGGYALLHYVYGRFVQGAAFHPQLPPDIHMLAAHQILDVALPEEFFFRAYLQTNLNRAWGRPYRVFGARCGWGVVAAAAIFAACHLVYGDVTQLKVFFFGLFAGWMRERTHSIVAPVAYHAAGNLLLQFMLVSFR